MAWWTLAFFSPSPCRFPAHCHQAVLRSLNSRRNGISIHGTSRGKCSEYWKILAWKKKKDGRASEKKRVGGERVRVIESFAFLENIIDRLELIGARLLLLEFSLWNAHCGKPLIGATRNRKNSAWDLFSQQSPCYCSSRFEIYASPTSVRTMISISEEKYFVFWMNQLRFSPFYLVNILWTSQ